eukprot:GDKI01010754.1.p1 GENE.GDKI01010754.1~~GDKI01010754.1.p1  ORF type:complete len:105 (-),score=9.08 GDKI01010754.1:104-418(-)
MQISMLSCRMHACHETYKCTRYAKLITHNRSPSSRISDQHASRRITACKHTHMVRLGNTLQSHSGIHWCTHNVHMPCSVLCVAFMLKHLPASHAYAHADPSTKL